MKSVYKHPSGERLIKSEYGRLLQRWPVSAQHATIATRQGDTFVVSAGPADAPPLVLLHGSGTNSLMWIGNVAAWARHFRVHAVDLIGEPGFSAPSRPPLGSGAYADWLDDVFDGLGLGPGADSGPARPAIVGTSLGGWLALDYAIRRPGRVSRLALTVPSGVGRQRWGVLITAILLSPLGRRGKEITLRRALGVPGSPAPGELGDFMSLIHQHFRPRFDRLPRFSVAALSTIDAPVLAIVGGRDAMLDSRETKQLLEAAGKQVRLLPDAGHLLPDQTRPVLDFLKG